MKKLKFLALGLAGLMAFASCGKEDDEEGFETIGPKTVFVGAGSNTTAGSYLTKDGEVYLSKDINDNGSTAIILVGNVKDGVASIKSGTVCDNGYVNGTYAAEGKGKNGEEWSTKASETRFDYIKGRKADPAKIVKMKVTEFESTAIDAVEEGDYIGFYNETLNLRGFLQVKAIAKDEAATNGITFEFTIVKEK